MPTRGVSKRYSRSYTATCTLHIVMSFPRTAGAARHPIYEMASNHRLHNYHAFLQSAVQVRRMTSWLPTYCWWSCIKGWNGNEVFRGWQQWSGITLTSTACSTIPKKTGKSYFRRHSEHRLSHLSLTEGGKAEIQTPPPYLFVFKPFHFLKCDILIDRLQGVLFYLCPVGTDRIKIYL